MDVSVIIPTYQRAHWLPRAIQSVLTQRLQPRELIIVDDGSTDGTGRLVRERFPQVHYLYQPNRGVSAARNLGAQHAQGEWLAWLDSDDEWLSAKLLRQCQALSKAPGYRLCHCDELWIRDGRRVNPMRKHAKHGGYIFRYCLPLCVISPSAAVVHRSLFEELGGFDEELPACEDYDLWLRVCAREPVLLVAEPLLVKYGGHADQLSRRFFGMDRFRIRALEKILADDGLGEADRTAVWQTLQEKIQVYAQGAEKRGRIEEAERYRDRLAHYPGLSERWELPLERL